jgi:glycosyltransferase involved in cell wall biosynthesis
MKIGIDISPIEDSPAGIGQYTANLLEALLDIDKTNEYVLYSTRPYETEKINIVIKRSKVLPFKGISWMIKVANHAKKSKIDLFISPSNHLFALLLKKVITFVYDISPILYPQFYSVKGAATYKYGIRHIVPKSWKIVTITETSKKELVAYSKIPANKIEVIYPSINQKIFNEAIGFVDLGLPQKYLLSISTLSPKKNYPALLEGFKKYLTSSGDNQTQLVIIGRKGWYYNEIFEKLHELELADKVRFLGYVEDKFIKAVLERASGLVSLSEHEGFGMPVLEALTFDLPVVANDIPVYRECFDGSVTFVNGKDPESVAEGIKTILTNKGKSTFDKDKFSWQKSAMELLKLFSN